MNPLLQSEPNEEAIPQGEVTASAPALVSAPTPEAETSAPVIKEVKQPEPAQLTTLEKAEAVLIEAIKHVAVLVEKELGHCPSAAALQSRVGNALEMLGSLKREAATLKAPESKSS